MRRTDLSESAENYLKTILRLSSPENEYIKPKTLMRFLPYAPSTVTITLQRLAKKGYIIYEKYRGVRLTEKGEIRAAEVLRNHRIFEVFLYEKLNIDFVTAHTEACKLEHVVSEATINKLEEFLNFPDKCPHGNPIPSRSLKISRPYDISLLSVDPGEYIVSRIAFETPDILALMEKIGVKPGVKIIFLDYDKRKMLVNVKVDDKQYTIPSYIAGILRVLR